MNALRRYFYIVASLLMTCYGLVVAKSIVSPLLAAFIFALALQPLASRLECLRIPRLASAILCVVLLIVTLSGILFFFSFQVSAMDFSLNSIKVSYTGILGKVQHLITDTLRFSVEEQTSLLKEFYTSALKNSASFINNTLAFTTNFFSSLVIFIIALIFILYYRRFLITFLFKIVDEKNHLILKRIVRKMPQVVKNYVLGLFLIILIIAVLNSLGLIILGINNAIVFGVMAAVLTLIPYVGILIGSLLPMIFVFLTRDSLWYPLGVLGVFMVVQFLEGNFLTPNIVGNQVSINPFAAILGLIFGASLLGIVGILFALPTLALFKAICDEIPVLSPLGYVLGNAPSGTT
ncbi:MAG: AI-2E family transporter [Legionella sp.]|nr:AI-2E family transporter [Legionella sp.]